MVKHKPGTQHSNSGYETRDAHFRNLTITGVGLLLLMAVMLVLTWGVFGGLDEISPQPGEFPGTFVKPKLAAPSPALQANPSLDLAGMRAREDSVLNNYGWVDRRAGITRIPIDTAMNLLLRQGITARNEY